MCYFVSRYGDFASATIADTPVTAPTTTRVTMNPMSKPAMQARYTSVRRHRLVSTSPVRTYSRTGPMLVQAAGHGAGYARRVSSSAAVRCPCSSGETYGVCCGPLHNGDATAPTAERLMRSRFSAFALGDSAYLMRSWHPSTRPAALELDGGVRWYRLDIVNTVKGGPFDRDGIVEFCAFYKGASVGVQEETSRFLRENGAWFYVDAV